jgi:hypothetical protein
MATDRVRMLTQEEQDAQRLAERDNYMRQMKDLMMMPVPSNPIFNAPPDKDFEEVRFDSAERAMYAMSKISLLHGMKKITDKEAARLVSLMDSKDEENWTVAEECINQKFSEI